MQVGEILIQKGVITREQLEKALVQQATSGKRIGDILISLGFATKEQIESALQ